MDFGSKTPKWGDIEFNWKVGLKSTLCLPLILKILTQTDIIGAKAVIAYDIKSQNGLPRDWGLALPMLIFIKNIAMQLSLGLYT